MSLETVLSLAGFVGLYDEYSGGWVGRIHNSVLVVFIIVDFVSILLDWQLFFQMRNEEFSFIANEETGMTDESVENTKNLMAWSFMVCIVVSHLIFLRGKWFYLHHEDWYNFSVTEMAVFAIEDAYVLFIFVFTDLYDNNDFSDRLNLVLSNISGYLILLTLWWRIVYQEGKTVPCRALLLPLVLTCLVALYSATSYTNVMQGLVRDEDQDGFIDVDSDEPLFAFWIAPFGTVVLSLSIFLYSLILLCCWGSCFRWTRQGGALEENETPDKDEEDSDTGNKTEDKHHNLWLFLLFWNTIFGLAILFGKVSG